VYYFGNRLEEDIMLLVIYWNHINKNYQIIKVE